MAIIVKTSAVSNGEWLSVSSGTLAYIWRSETAGGEGLSSRGIVQESAMAKRLPQLWRTNFIGTLTTRSLSCPRMRSRLSMRSSKLHAGRISEAAFAATPQSTNRSGCCTGSAPSIAGARSRSSAGQVCARCACWGALALLSRPEQGSASREAPHWPPSGRPRPRQSRQPMSGGCACLRTQGLQDRITPTVRQKSVAGQCRQANFTGGRT
jgi:hypothetical protein